jgi:uncharacterized SAM-binding protein YcdF (DUF218 family)
LAKRTTIAGVTELLARALAWPLEKGRTDVGRADAIVVLGGPLAADGRLSRVVDERVRAAVGVWKRGAAPIVCLTGGRTRGAAIAEAEVMAERARQEGLPESAIVVEACSASTYENARNVGTLLLPRGIRRIILVTTPFHLRRGVRWFTRAGFDAQGFLIADSVQREDARWALRWIAREYGSWVLSYWISVSRWITRRRVR